MLFIYLVFNAVLIPTRHITAIQDDKKKLLRLHDTVYFAGTVFFTLFFRQNLPRLNWSCVGCRVGAGEASLNSPEIELN